MCLLLRSEHFLQKPRAERTIEEQREIEEEDAAAAQELFCVCQQPDDPEAPRDFVQCDKCQQWFHPECVNTTTQVGPAILDPGHRMFTP